MVGTLRIEGKDNALRKGTRLPLRVVSFIALLGLTDLSDAAAAELTGIGLGEEDKLMPVNKQVDQKWEIG